jgi:hypothetical protein
MPNEISKDLRPITASEGAARVAARFKRERRNFDAYRDTTRYSCENCGSDGFYVERQYDVQETYETVLPCSCDGEHEYAARAVDVCTKTMSEWGPLEEDHRFAVEDSEVVDSQNQRVEEETSCERCSADADEADWDVDEQPETEEVDSSDEFYVRCERCDHEIEFGWSHPDRGGRIWPCESNDHNPWKSWPEPRYRDAWAARGWLRPTR